MGLALAAQCGCSQTGKAASTMDSTGDAAAGDAEVSDTVASDGATNDTIPSDSVPSSDTTPSSGDADGAGSGLNSVTDFCAAWRHWMCTAVVAQCPAAFKDPAALVGGAKCEAVLGNADVCSFDKVASAEAAIASGSKHFDGNAAAECLAQLAARLDGCGKGFILGNDSAFHPACNQVEVAAVPIGGACKASSDCMGYPAAECATGKCKVLGCPSGCDDGEPCTDDTCDVAAGVCKHAPKPGCVAAPKPCSQTSDCATGVCDVARHLCVPCVVSKDCGDGYKCAKQQCLASKTCGSGADCKATKQVCDKTDGVCVDCVTANDCGTDQLCVQSTCVAAPACKSDKDCTGVCDAGKGVCVGCVAIADCKAGTWCAPWQECVAAVCSGQACLEKALFACATDGSGYGSGKSCSDGVDCTDDNCDPATGCTNVTSDGKCDDGDACTVDSCGSQNGCSHVAKSCDDNEACTADSCAAATGTCKHDPKPNGPLGGTCCKGGVSSPSCDDGNACTSDSCVPAVGCQSIAIPSSPTAVACEDGNPCTLGDACASGVCAAGDANCDDGNGCTADSCIAANGCLHSPTTGSPCDDGDACTIGPTCIVGVCGAPKVCSAADEVCIAGSCTVPPPTYGMALIPAGTFWMGCNSAKDAACESNESPQHKVTLSPYYIDVTEVTVAQYKKCVDAGACTAPAAGSYTNWGTAGKEQNPVSNVSWAQAQTYCKWRGAGFDLPTEAQWEMAARGDCVKNGYVAGDPNCKTAMRTYPWGEAAPTCTYAVWYEGGNGCGTGSTWPVGSKTAGDSPYGLHDMAGNVWEWTRDWYGKYDAGDQTDATGPSSASYRAIRGTGFGGGGDAGDLRAALRGKTNPSIILVGLGARCSRSFP